MTTHTANFFDQLLSKSISRPHHTSTPEWHEHFLTTTEQLPSTLEQAALGGRMSINMSFAFSAGYQSAIQSLFKPNVRALASLCVTEKEGNLPKDIKSALTEQQHAWLLNGSKSFITGANDAKQLYVAVTEPRKPTTSESSSESSSDTLNERPKIKMLSIPANTQGIQITPMPALPFVPDISHGTANFQQVNILAENILEGDGHAQYVKPFRTHEDIHVVAATLGFRIGEALNSSWSQQSIEAHLMLLASVLSLNTTSFNEPTTHLIFSGCRSQFTALVDQTDEEFKRHNPTGFNHWKRDKALLDIASKAHTIRTQRAWENIANRS